MKTKKDFDMWFSAIHQGNFTKVKEIFKKDSVGDFINSQDIDGWALLHTLVEYEDGYHLNLLKEVLNHPNVNVNIQNVQHTTPLICAAQQDNYKALEVLLRHKNLDVNISKKSGYTALHYATEKQYIQSVDLLLNHKDINPNIRDKTILKTPLHCLFKHAYFFQQNKISHDLIKLFLEHPKFDINVPDIMGDTVLHYAATNPNLEYLKFIMKHSENKITLVNNINGDDFLILAQDNHLPEKFSQLTQWLADNHPELYLEHIAKNNTKNFNNF